MNIKIFVGVMFVIAIVLGVLLVIYYKKNKDATPLAIIGVIIVTLFCLSLYETRTQEWEVENTPFSTVTDKNHIKIELYKARREWLFLYEDNQVKKIVVPAGTPVEYYEKYLKDL